MWRTNHLKSDERYKKWKSQERYVCRMIAKFFRVSVIPATKEEDVDQKIDAWIKTKDGQHSVQIKNRDGKSGNDFGFCLCQPYFESYGVWTNCPSENVGRDLVSEAEFVAIQNKFGIYFARYNQFKHMMRVGGTEFSKSGRKFISFKSHFQSNHPLLSKVHEDGSVEYVEFRHTKDEKNKQHKIIMYCPIHMCKCKRIGESNV